MTKATNTKKPGGSENMPDMGTGEAERSGGENPPKAAEDPKPAEDPKVEDTQASGYEVTTAFRDKDNFDLSYSVGQDVSYLAPERLEYLEKVGLVKKVFDI